jgi:hypothetical protein
MSRSDPIRDNYYRPIERAERFSTGLFWFGAVFSLLLPVIEKNSPFYEFMWAAFALDAALLFILGVAVRLYWNPRAANARNKDFLSHACQVSLTHEGTDGYYNNDREKPPHRIAAQVLENALFSKKIALAMATAERAKVAVYFTLWFVCFFHRSTGLDVVVAATQVLFNEQVISRYLRLEWLRAECERVYDSTIQLFRSPPRHDVFMATALENFARYENAKASAAITLSERIFSRLNDELSTEWANIKKAFQI